MKKVKSPKFGSEQHMLEVLHQSYLYALDTVMYGGGQTICPRLSDKEGKQLGRDLAKYWDIKK